MRRLNILWVLMETPVTNAPFRYLVGELGKRHDASLCTYLPVGSAAAGVVGRLAGVFEGDGSVPGFIRAVRRALRDRSVDVVSIHLPQLALLALPLLALYQGMRWRRCSVFVVHNSLPVMRPRNRIFTVIALAVYRHIVVCGSAAAASLPRVVRRLAGPGLVVIPNGADIRGIEAADSSAVSGPGGFEIVTAARHEPVKRLEDTILGFARAEIDGARLLLIGDGSRRQSLEALAERAAPGRVRFTGMIAREEVYAEMLSADCFLSTSSGEGLPVAVLEAMAAGLPVVLSDIPPHREVADGFRGARFVPVGDVDGFAEAIRELAGRSTEDRRRMGAELRDHVAANFSLDAYLGAYEHLYLSLAGD